MFAITGASGKLGRAVSAELLRQTRAANLRLGSRTPEQLDPLAKAGARVTHTDFDDAESLARLFDGAAAALVISGDAANEPRIRQHETAFHAARRAGVGRIVYTSFANAVPESLFLVAPSHVASEAMLVALGVPYTILRNNLYAENIMVEAARTSALLVQPHSHGRAAYIAYADVARATVGAILGTGHENRCYEITGPEALSHYDIADRLSRSWGRTITVQDVSPAEYVDHLLQRGLPTFLVDLLASLHAAAGAGEYARVSADAADLAGGRVDSASAFLASV